LVETAKFVTFEDTFRCDQLYPNMRTPSYSAGAAFRQALHSESPLQLVGATTAQHALLAKQAGYQAIYVSGGGVAAGSLGIPDLGITTLQDVLIDVGRITNVCDLPVLVDIDTGFGPSAFNISRTIREMIKVGAAAVHIEDQAGAKRCGHRPNKSIVSTQEMVDRIKAAIDARTDDQFVIGARTDALDSEGLQSALDRAHAYAEAGADFIFAEAVSDIHQYAQFATASGLPILANITEFGRTPLWTVDQLKDAGVNMILYPLSAFRAANKAALEVYQTLRKEGTQQNLISKMQTRAELYDTIDYMRYENSLDSLQT
jgi:methylisocitrate lyase